MPEQHYNCEWCRDAGWVTCYVEHDRNYPIKHVDVLQTQQSRRYEYFTMAPCGFCEAGTFHGRPTADSLQAAERWVRENVTTIASLKGTYEKAEEEGFKQETIKQAFQRVGIRTFQYAGRWVCEPAP
jgi:hypothetical protein